MLPRVRRESGSGVRAVVWDSRGEFANMSTETQFTELIKAIEHAVKMTLERDTNTPSDIDDPAVLIAALAPCPDCGVQVDASLCMLEMKAEWEEKLLTEVLRNAVPPRFQPVVRAMMVHLDKCEGVLR